VDKRNLNILMMVHRLEDASPYCFFVHEQARTLAARGHRVTVISCVLCPPLASRLRPEAHALDLRTPARDRLDGVEIVYPRALSLGDGGDRLFGGSLMALAAFREAKRMHEAAPFDLIHAHMLPRDGHAALLIGRRLGVPVVLTVHGTDVLRYFGEGITPWKRNVKIAREVDALMAVSPMLLNRVRGCRGEKAISRVVENGVDLSLIPEVRENRPGRILSVGTLKARKCMDRTLSAFARVAGEFPQAELTLIGEGPDREALLAMARELGVAQRVHLTGGMPHRQVLEEMSRSDLFLLPSWGEGFGIVYIEAMAAGCLAVGARNEGIDGTLRDGENGFLVDAGSVDQMEQILRRCLGDPASVREIRMAGMRTAREMTWERNARETEEVYRQVLDGKQEGLR